MNCFEIVENYAKEFSTILAKNSEPVDFPEFPWKNQIWRSSKFRRAHVEEFVSPAISVLHVTVFPHLNDPSPIYGFDVVTGAKKPAGGYIDMSPSVETWHGWRNWISFDVPPNKTIPEWGTCFSDEFVAIPLRDSAHLEELLKYGVVMLSEYLSRIQQKEVSQEFVIDRQRFYCEQQRNNQKTMQILERMIGAERANLFMNEVLFPDPIAGVPTSTRG
jgi:phycocyanobilin:ferredoxin oxidoreductase